MYEKIVENWLTSVNELGYQLPFCEVLVAEGYTVLYVSRHGRGEHGKDVVARRADGQLCTFQLKGGDITLAEWRSIRGEVEELVCLPVRVPGVSELADHIPFLVTNGEIRGDATESIKRFTDQWVRRGSPELQVWQRGALLEKFLSAHGSYLPQAFEDFRDFVNLYVGPFNKPLPREKFANLLESLATKPTRGLSQTQLRRAIASLTVVAGYIVEQYAQASNHLAAAEGWVIAAACILYIAERDALPTKVYEMSLSLVRIGFERSLDELVKEATATEDFVVAAGGLVDPMVYGVRATQVIGWLGCAAAEARRTGQNFDRVSSLKLFRREGSAIQWVGEADWPLRLSMVIWLEGEGYFADGEQLLISWAASITRASKAGRPGVPSPYWLQEKVLRRQYGLLAPTEDEQFGHHTYTVSQCLDMLVRRLRRQAVAALWPDVTRLNLCNYVSNTPEGTFLWRTNDGVLHERLPERTAHWSLWRERVAKLPSGDVPQMLVRHPEWLLPFLIVYPHRATQTLTSFADFIFGKRLALT